MYIIECAPDNLDKQQLVFARLHALIQMIKHWTSAKEHKGPKLLVSLNSSLTRDSQIIRGIQYRALTRHKYQSFDSRLEDEP